ncbi:MAG: hypothetical protein JO061_13620 [Acidobacteriaceae bacterium]|nr:hypothetical protein [Acidobacteriaceae bacterium]
MKTAAVVLGILLAVLAAPLVAAKLGIFKAHQDVGISPMKGKVKYDTKSNQYAVTGSGANIWAKVDAFQFVYKQISGDLTFSSDIEFLGTGVEQHRKAGLMIRQSLSPDSAYADVMLHGDGMTSLQCRETAGAETKETRTDVKHPQHVRIERRGNQFTMAVSNEGAPEQTTGPITVQLQDPVYVGLAVSAHNAKVRETAIFSNVKLTQGQTQQNTEVLRLLARF